MRPVRVTALSRVEAFILLIFILIAITMVLLAGTKYVIDVKRIQKEKEAFYDIVRNRLFVYVPEEISVNDDFLDVVVVSSDWSGPINTVYVTAHLVIPTRNGEKTLSSTAEAVKPNSVTVLRTPLRLPEDIIDYRFHVMVLAEAGFFREKVFDTYIKLVTQPSEVYVRFKYNVLQASHGVAEAVLSIANLGDQPLHNITLLLDLDKVEVVEVRGATSVYGLTVLRIDEVMPGEVQYVYLKLKPIQEEAPVVTTVKVRVYSGQELIFERNFLLIITQD